MPDDRLKYTPESVDAAVSPMSQAHMEQVGRAFEISHKYTLGLAFDAGYKAALQDYKLAEFGVPKRDAVVDTLASFKPKA